MKRVKCFLIVALLALLGAPHAPAWTIYIIPSGKYIESVYVKTTTSAGETAEPLGATPGKQIMPLDLDPYGRYVITGSDNISTVTISNNGADEATFTGSDLDGKTFDYVTGTGWTANKLYTFDIYYDDAFISSDKVYAQFTNLPSGHSYTGLNYFTSTGTAEGYFSRYKGNIWRLSVMSDYDIASNQPTGFISGPNIKIAGTDGADIVFQNGYVYYTTSTTPVEIATNSYYLTATCSAYSSSYKAITNPVIKSMKIVYVADGSTVNLSPSVDGSTTTYIGSGIKPRAKFYVETSDGSTTTQWFTSYLLELSKVNHSNWQHRYLSDYSSSITADGTADSYVATFTLSNDKTRITGFECQSISAITKAALKTTDGDATKTLPLELTYNYADDGTTVTSITATAIGKTYTSAKYYLELNGSTKLYAATSTDNVASDGTFNEIDYTDWGVYSTVADVFRIKSTYISNYDYIKISATLNPDGTVTAFSAAPIGRADVASAVALPLTEADFTDANGNAKPHYFLVGTRTADWRMLPEWELTPSDDGTAATLAGRFMYRGAFGIAMVDNYSDYCAQKYVLYNNNLNETSDNWKKFSDYYVTKQNANNVPLIGMGAWNAIAYSSEEAPNLQTLYWSIDKNSSSNYVYADGLNTCTATYINKLTVTLDANGAPSALAFDYSTDDSVILDNTSFALVGSDLTGPQNADGMSLDYLSLESVNSGSNTSGWAGSWVSCDADGTPYQVSDNTTLPLTAYDRAWLTAHPVTLYNAANGETISSKDITFVPASELADDESDRFRDLYKMHPTVSTSIGSGSTLTSGEFNLKEQIEANGTSEGSISASDWKCYVLKDLWLNGQFKVWTGWGGNIKKYNCVDDGDAENAEQWYSVNGGHGNANTDAAVYGYDPKSGTINRLYSMAQNVDDANFLVKVPTVFNRVLLWYNPSYGLDKSVLQFVQLTEVYLNVDGNYNITTAPNDRDDADQCAVVGYTIYRYKKDADGKYIFDGVVKSVSRGDEEYDSKDASYWTVANLIDNPITLTDNPESAGQSYYSVEYTFEKDGLDWVATAASTNTGSGTGATADGDVKITVFQQTETGTTGDATGQTLYSFNVEADVTVNLDDDPAAMTAHSVYVTADARTGSLLNTATSFEMDGDTLSENQLKLNDYSSTFSGINDAYAWEIPIQYFKTNSDGKRMVHLVWHNVMPTRTENGLLSEWNDDSKRDLGEYSDNSLVTVNTDDKGFAYTLNAYLIEDVWSTTDTGKVPFTGTLPDKSDDLHSDASYQDEDGNTFYYQGQSLWAYDTDDTQVIAPGVTLSIERIRMATGHGSSSMSDFINNGNEEGLWEPSGSRLKVMDGNTVTDRYIDIHPAWVTATCSPAAVGYISYLPVTDEVANNFNINYNLYVYPIKDASSWSGESVSSWSKVSKTVTYNYLFDWNSKQNTTGIGGNWGVPPLYENCDPDYTHSYSFNNHIDGAITQFRYSFLIDNSIGITYSNDILTTYSPKTDDSSTADRNSAAELTYVHDGNSVESVLSYWLEEPRVNVDKTAYVKYEDLYYNDAYTEHVGYYAHIGVDLTFSNPQFWDGGYELANFPGFFFQQKACYEDGVGCYPTTTKVDGVEMLKHSFAGTSAANGGLPLNFQYGSGDNTIYPIGVYYSSYLEDYDWNNCYVEYDITTHNRNTYNGWWSDYDWENDWSYEAHCYGRLSLMINPAYHYPTKEAYESGVMSGELSGEISYNMPVIWSKYLSINYNTTNYKDKTALTILSSTTSVTIPLDKVSMATGIEEVEGDLTAGDGEAVYYNLQGIRVSNPERGQIYIVRRSNTATKCLFK